MKQIALALWLLVVISLVGGFDMSEESEEVKEVYEKIDIVGQLQDGGEGDTGKKMEAEILKSMERHFESMKMNEK
ncbi:unnamed protein product [Diamesa hyperborea]